MKLVKCPRCDLNYIREDEKYCKVCLREMKGEPTNDDMELCSVCNAAPALPGKDVCLSCLKEMQSGGGREEVEDEMCIRDSAIYWSHSTLHSVARIIP